LFKFEVAVGDLDSIHKGCGAVEGDGAVRDRAGDAEGSAGDEVATVE
jgi:hypothetical protein